MGQEGEPWEGQVREGSGHMGLEGGSLGGGVGRSRRAEAERERQGRLGHGGCSGTVGRW